MSCYRPLTIKNVVGMQTMQVPCGRCNFCRRDKKNDWCFRLMQHNNHSQCSSFITLTYDEEHIPREPITLKGEKIPNPKGRYTLHKPDLQQFHKNIKQWERDTHQGTTSLDYYAAGEYGSKFGRPHYHTILMNHRPETLHQVSKFWDKGLIHIGEVTPASIAYVSKYIIDKQHQLYTPVKPFNMMSKGIGEGYMTEAMMKYHRPNDDTDEMVYYVKDAQFKKKMPRYYRDRIFSQEDRIQLGLMQYQLGLEKQHERIEHLFWQEYKTHALASLDEFNRTFTAWEIAFKKYLHEVEVKHEKIGLKSLQLNSL